MATIDHPYQNLTGGHWLRGNLHTHTTRSDGARDSQAVIDDYAARGYDFLALSDHDLLTSAADLAELDDRGMILIPGNEISANGPHLLHVDGQTRVPPHEDRQRVIDDVQREGGFAIFNHPNWERVFNHCPQELLDSCHGYMGLEIYNGVICRLNGSPYATDRWDMLLGQGRQLWGFANDDSHAEQDVALGWNMVYARERTAEAVASALRAGRFYASTGVVIAEITVDGREIRVATENADRVVALADVGRRIAQADEPALEVALPEDAKYVRFECWGRGEQRAWTQAFFVGG